MIEVSRIESGVRPHGGRLSRDESMFYAVNVMGYELVEIDATGFNVKRRLTLGDGVQPTWVTKPTVGGRVFVTGNNAAKIFEVDIQTWQIVRSFDTGPGPYNLAVTPDESTLIVTYKTGAAVGFWDLRSGLERARIETSRTIPHGVVVTPDGAYAFVPLEGVGVAMEGEDGGDLVSGINTAGGSDKGGPSDAHGAAEWLIGAPLGRVGPVQRLHRAVDQRKKRALIERKIQVGVAEAEDELAIDASGVAVHAVGADNGRAVGRLDGSEVVGHAAVDAGALELIAGQQRVRGTKHANGHTGVDVVAVQQIALAGIGIARSLWRGRDGSGARRMRGRRRPCLCRQK